MKVVHINDSYKIWSVNKMRITIDTTTKAKYGTDAVAETLLHRTYKSMYVEWWLHNIGYYVTYLFRRIPSFYKINIRCKDVDLEEWAE